MKASTYKRSTIPTFKNNNGDAYIYGNKYMGLLLDMIQTGVKTKEIDKNIVTIDRTVYNDEEYTVYVSLARI